MTGTLRSMAPQRMGTDTLLKISLCLIALAALSTALVYAETVPVEIDGTAYDIEYEGEGTSITSAEADLDFVSVILYVSAPDGGTLDVTFDDAIFEALCGTVDDEFVILVDGDEPGFTESSTSQDRTFGMNIPSLSEEVEIFCPIGFSEPADDMPVEDVPVDDMPVDQTDVMPADDMPSDDTVMDQTDTAMPADEEPDAMTEMPVEDTADPEDACGPGTVYADGECVLDQTCGGGTVYRDGECVLDDTAMTEPAKSPAFAQGAGRQMLFGLLGGFFAAGVVGVFLGIIAKAHRG